jgi:Big-like domain-containing protein/galactose oxidase-like protein/Kelch motif protein
MEPSELRLLKSIMSSSGPLSLKSLKMFPVARIWSWLFLAMTATIVQISSGTLFGFDYSGDLITARAFHTATLLPNGKVLVAGGITNSVTLPSSELYDPATGTWSATGNLNSAHGAHTATLLTNGKVLVVGGDATRASSELYDPATGTWTTTGSLNIKREEHTATLLDSGKVLVVGGSSDNSDGIASAELYDPASGTWSITGSLNAGRKSHTATRLPNGKVLVAGGIAFNPDSINTAELYDPASGTWSVTGSLNTARHQHKATLLSSGKVLVTGGLGSSGALASAEIYDPSTGKWTATGVFGNARFAHTATLLPNARVLLVGGINNNIARNSAELYDPTSGSWSPTDSLNTARYYHTATLLPNGKVLVAGGFNSSHNVTASTELSDAKAYSSVAVSSSLNPSEKGETVTFVATVSAVGPSPLTGTIQFKDNGANLGPPIALNAMFSASYSTSSLALGPHTITAEYSGDANGTPSTGTLTGGQTVYAASTLGNISTRLEVGVSENVLISGFIIEGTAPKRVMIRAIGPSLANFGVGNVLANPQLELHNNSATIGLNDNWQTTQVGGVIPGDQVQEIQDSGLAPSDGAESAIIATLAPGSYTAVVHGSGNSTGIGTAEVYDLSERASGARLGNISTRGSVQTNDRVMIGGIIVVRQPTKVVIRALGPSLQHFGIANTLSDPQLELHNAAGTLARNDNWQTTQIGGAITADQTTELLNSGLAPDNPAEAALIVTLQPGNYTAILQGVNGTTGVALIEIYALP